MNTRPRVAALAVCLALLTPALAACPGPATPPFNHLCSVQHSTWPGQLYCPEDSYHSRTYYSNRGGRARRAPSHTHSRH